MRKTLLGSIMLLAPAALAAQGGAQAKVSSQSTVSASASSPKVAVQARDNVDARSAFVVPERFSAAGRVKLEAMYADARKRGLPAEPMEKRVEEGEVKAASEASILVAAGRVKADMESTQEAMLAAGHRKPSPEECARGAMLMARGATSADIETMARHAPSDRSLVVAFDVVSQLAAEGLPVSQALARVQAKIDGRASDAILLSLPATATSTVGIGAAAGGHAAAGTTNAAAQGTANAATKGTTAGVAGTVSGTVSGVLKKP